MDGFRGAEVPIRWRAGGLGQRRRLLRWGKLLPLSLSLSLLRLRVGGDDEEESQEAQRG